MCGSAAWQVWNMASTLTAKESRQSSAVSDSSGPRRLMPALLHRTSILPSVAITFAMMDWHPLAVMMSAAKARARPPLARMEAAAASAPLPFTSVKIICAPSAAKRAAMADPIPPAAPVTITDLS